MITNRPYRGSSDYALMHQVIGDEVAVRWPGQFMDHGDLDWWAKEDTSAEDLLRVQIWFDGERPIGWVWPKDDQADMVHNPAYPAIEREQVAWYMAQPLAEGGEKKLFCYRQDTARAELMAAHGLVRSDPDLTHRARMLADLPPVPALPAGYTLRHLRGPEEVAARVEAHRSAFAPSKMTAAKHLRVMAAPTYRQELDLLVAAPDGSVAAFALTWYDAHNRVGSFEPVGCHSDHQRKGLTRALLLHGMHTVAALGGRGMGVFSESDTALPAPKLYDAVGLTVVDVLDTWVG
jgi:ribosomal protein S18 acetylase RimI-like enzyme